MVSEHGGKVFGHMGIQGASKHMGGIQTYGGVWMSLSLHIQVS